MKASMWIVILNYMTYELTMKCADLLSNQDYPELHIVIVDNASTNESGRILEQYCKQNGCYYVEANENGGYAKGNNLGIRLALKNNAEYVMVLNNDVKLSDTNFITRIVEYMDKNPEIGLMGPSIYTNGHKDIVLMQNRPKAKTEILKNLARIILWLIGKTKRHRKEQSKRSEIENKNAIGESKQVYAISGCCMVFAAHCLRKIDCFDEGTFLYNEELIVGEKCFQNHIPIIYNTNFNVLHAHGVTIKKFFQVKKQYLLEETSRLYYYKKYRQDISKVEFIFLKISIVFNRIINVPIIRFFESKREKE